MSPRPSSKILLRNREIVRCRMNGERSGDLARTWGISAGTVIGILRRAHEGGVEFPELPRLACRGGGGRKHRLIPETVGDDTYREPKPKRALPFETLTVEEESRLRELANRNLGLTGIAAILRRQYRTVDAALVRLGLSRAGVGARS